MENEKPSITNTPSKLRPPKARKDVFSLVEATLELNTTSTKQAMSRSSAQKPRIHSPRSERAKVVSLPEAIPAPISVDPRVKTYKSTATATGRPQQPVTKPGMNRAPPRTAATGKPVISRNAYNSADSVAMSSGQRPLWDRKGRLEEMEKVVSVLRERVEATTLVNSSTGRELEEIRSKVRILEEDKEHLLAKVARKEREIDNLNDELQQLGKQQERVMNDRNLEYQEALGKLRFQLQEATESREKLSAEYQACRQELANVTTECVALKTTLSTQSAAILDSDAQIRALQNQKLCLDEKSSDQEALIKKLESTIAGLRQDLQAARGKLQEGETLRRKLHNTVQELKGNIRVFCRVRPTLPGEEGPGGEALNHIAIGLNTERQEEIKLIQASESASGNQISKAYPFTFDKVFNPNATQKDVFEEISQLVQSALDGYRVCIFAYGQTGSGKTFTMEGDARDPERLGMIPRAVEQIFISTELLRERGWSFNFEASYLEIYNETIRDLLSGKGADPEAKYDIRHVDGQTIVSDLTITPVSAPLQILDLLKKAATNRAVAETQCNERSSRSHSVFTLRICGTNSVTTEKIEGLLHLVDLAGSERLSQSGSTGDRLKETQAINKSLSSLGDVIHAIANREAHIPYRNSKLTYLLQTSLGGNCKTLMFVNVSPVFSSLGESLCSLRFAAKVNACQIGTATRKVTK